ADDHDDAARHVFAAMVADALDDGGDTRIAHGEPFTGDAAEIGLALGRAVKHGIADDDGFFGAYPAVFRRTDDETAARQPLADIVVGSPFQLERYAARQKCAERLPGRTGEFHRDRIFAQALVPEASCYFARQHRPDRTIDIADRHFDRNRLPGFKRRPRLFDQRAVENGVDRMLLALGPVGFFRRQIQLVEHFREIEPARLPVVDQRLLL